MTLFLRGYGGVRLTSDGKQLLPWIQDVCNSEHHLNEKINEMKKLESGTVRIAAFTSIAIHWLPGMLQEFLRQYPNMQFDLRCCDDQEKSEQMVWRGDVDCAFFVLPVQKESEIIHLAQDPMLTILPENHPLAKAPYFPIDALSEYPYIKLDNGIYSEMDELFLRHKKKPNICLTVNNDYAVMALVSKGFGFSIFPKLILCDILFPLVCKELEVPAHRELVIGVRSQQALSAAARSFINCARKWVCANNVV